MFYILLSVSSHRPRVSVVGWKVDGKMGYGDGDSGGIYTDLHYTISST